MSVDQTLTVVCGTLAHHRKATTAERVALFNELAAMLAKELLFDLPADPALTPQLIHVNLVEGNDYNPNKTAQPELALLETSMREDGITMPVVTVKNGDTWTVVDGFHRRMVAADALGRQFIPCAVIDKPIEQRMASTVRHNRARGKHQVDLMGALVRSLIEHGLGDAEIAVAMGMSEEELLRLKQTVGAAKMLAASEYTRAWRGRDGEDSADE